MEVVEATELEDVLEEFPVSSATSKQNSLLLVHKGKEAEARGNTRITYVEKGTENLWKVNMFGIQQVC